LLISAVGDASELLLNVVESQQRLRLRMTSAMNAADSLDYFLPSVLSADTKRRLEAGDELIAYLRNKQTSLRCDEMDKLADGLASWVSSSSFKV